MGRSFIILQSTFYKRWKLILSIVTVVTIYLALFGFRSNSFSHRITGSFDLSSLQVPQKEEVRDEVLRHGMYRPEITAYNLLNPNNVDFSRGQSKIIDDLILHKENGYFLDIGAGDGETGSVSLFFERQRHWTGVLLDANEYKVRAAVSKNRQAIIWNVKIRMDRSDNPLASNEIRTQDIFTFLNRTVIDLLIVNLNGWEFELIRSINFDKVRIKVITIEMQNDVKKESYFEVTNYLMARGYTVAHHLIYFGKKDVIYIND